MRRYTSGTSLKTGEVIILDPGLIQPGDIVLTGEPELQSWIIRTFSVGGYSHAAICTRPGLLMEANLDDFNSSGQVRRVSVMRVIATHPKFVRVLRLNADIPNRQEIIEKATAKAEQKLSSEYWLKAVLRFFWPIVPENERKRFFCSHLVGYAYKKAGVELLPGRASETIAPGDIEESPHLRDVTDEVIQIEKEPVVRASLPTSGGPHQEIEIPTYQRLLADPQVAAILAKHGRIIPTTYRGLLRALEQTQDRVLDQIIASAVQEMQDKFEDSFRQYGMTDEHLTQLRRALESGSLSRDDIEFDLRYSRSLEKVMMSDVHDREQDIAYFEQKLFDGGPILKRDGLHTFWHSFKFADGYKRFMAGQLVRLRAKIAMLERHSP
jgi:hypothetical protein